jgi:alpha-amylase
MHRSVQKSCKDSTLLLTFASNHDTARLAAFTSSLVLRENALAYTILSDGIPTLYQGDEQGFSAAEDPENREAMWLSGFDRNAALYVMIRTLNKLRAWVGQRDPNYWISTSSIFWNDTQTLAMRKGSNGSQIVTILTNGGDSMVSKTTRISSSGFTAGTALLEVLACEETVVGHDGVLSVDMSGGNPKVYFPLHQLYGSTICQPWLFKPEAHRLSYIARLFAQLSP